MYPCVPYRTDLPGVLKQRDNARQFPVKREGANMHNVIRIVVLVLALGTSGWERAAQGEPPKKPAVLPHSQPASGLGADLHTGVASAPLGPFKAAW